MPQALQQFSSLLEVLAIPLTTTTLTIEGKEERLAQGPGRKSQQDNTTKKPSSSSTSSTSNSSSAIYHRTMVLALLDVFRCLNNPCMKSVLTVEYAKTLVADLAHACLLRSGEGISEEDTSTMSKQDKGKGSMEQQQGGKQGQSSKNRSSKRVNESSSSSSEGISFDSPPTYSTARVIEDVEQVLICLGNSITNESMHHLTTLTQPTTIVP